MYSFYILHLVVLDLLHLGPVPPVDVLDGVALEDAALGDAADDRAQNAGVAAR